MGHHPAKKVYAGNPELDGPPNRGSASRITYC
jgi:hypothetical protein